MQRGVNYDHSTYYMMFLFPLRYHVRVHGDQLCNGSQARASQPAMIFLRFCH